MMMATWRGRRSVIELDHQTAMISSSLVFSILSSRSTYSLVSASIFSCRVPAVVLGDLAVLLELLQHLDGVAPVVAHRHAVVLGELADVLHQVAAALLGELGNRARG